MKKHIDLIENVQRKFTKRIPLLKNLSYLQRLNFLKLESLELRRLHFDLVGYFKILHNLTPHDPSDFFTLRYPPTFIRNNTPYLLKPKTGSKLFFSSFQNRAIDCFNSLNNTTRDQKSLPSFKRLIKTENLNNFLYGSCFTELSDFNVLNF